MEMCVIISTAAFFMLAVLALIDGRKISAMLVNDSFDFHV